MKNNFLIHKFLPILSVFLLALFVLCTDVFASSRDFVVDKDTVINCPDYDDSKQDYFLFSNVNASGIESYYLITWDSSVCTVISNSSSDVFGYCIDNSGKLYKGIRSYSCSKSNISSGFKLYQSSTNHFGAKVHTPISGNKDIYYALTSDGGSTFKITDTLVFQGAPQVTVPEITKALVEQTTQLGMKPLEIIKEILPIVAVTIVGLIAFWKAWQHLSKQLKKA